MRASRHGRNMSCSRTAACRRSRKPRAQAVTTVLSGPAGGVTASVRSRAASGGFSNLITFDMGGTSCDVALIKDGEPSCRNRGKIEGRDLAVPMIDINTVSAGGGTIARVDRFGVLEVGPQSAGAVPGPAATAAAARCRPSPTAICVLGYLGERQFPRRQACGSPRQGASRRSRARSRGRSRSTRMEAAEGIIRIIDVKMQEAIKAISTMRGHDLRDFMLLAFGGAGPASCRAHCAGSRHGRSDRAALSRRAFRHRPAHVGRASTITSARGMTPLSMLTLPSDINAMFAQLGAQAREELATRRLCAGATSASNAPSTCATPGRAMRSTVACDGSRSQTDALNELRANFDRRAPSHVWAYGAGASRSRSCPIGCAGSALCRRSRCRDSSPAGIPVAMPCASAGACGSTA